MDRVPFLNFRSQPSHECLKDVEFVAASGLEYRRLVILVDAKAVGKSFD